jgi:5-formyltetrahydrofolate cyclo-ligase
MTKKEKLRKKYYSIRKKSYFDVRPNFFNPLIKLIKKNNKKIINLSSYYPSSFEVNTLKLFEINLKKKIKILLPAIRRKHSMNFYKWNNKEILKVNKFGMLEPYKQLNQVIPDIMLVPLLSYDKNKSRLGYGKGFYDRYLKKYSKKNNNILTIGIAFSFQKYHILPVSHKDINLNYILTEKGIF